ncbi:MAG: hypothetical protein NE328_09825 [Lentisphaeraceae bacterium]|nr:hypothetical protein [Lentisphaeraceae bacterium]
MELEVPLNDKAKLFYQVTGDKNKTERFEADIDGTVCEMDFEINKRGTVTGTLGLSMATGEVCVFSTSTKLPELITLHNSSYRGILSTKRRLPDVKFDVDIAIIDEDLTNTKLVLRVLDSSGKSVSIAKRDFSTNKIPSKLTIAVPMDKALKAGEYTVRAELIAPKAEFDEVKSEVKIKIFAPHPAQTIIDEDRTFLVDGKPFFPMGIYHVTPKDYPRMKEIGFNTVQFWMWDNSQDKDGKLIAASKAHKYDLKLIVEGLHAENFDMRLNTLGKHPAMLMWYAFDELNERGFGGAKKMTDLYNKDEQHPVYGLSCRPDLFKRTSQLIDTFAYNAGTNAEAYRIVGHGTHKATIYVPGSFSDAIPDPNTMRFKAYDGLVHDVRGIMWYCWYQIGGGPIGRGLHNSEKHQKVVQQVCKEIKIMEAGLTSSMRRPFKVNNRINGYVCGDQSGKRFLIMMNHTDKAVDVSYIVDELSQINKVRDPFIKDKKMTIEIKGGLIKRTFKPNEILVYNW